MSASALAREIRARDVSATEGHGRAHRADRAAESRAQRHRDVSSRAGARARPRSRCRARARRALGPLAGLPVAHKDLVPTRGVRTTFGSRIYRDFVPDADAILVERLRERRRDHDRQDQHAGIRRGFADLQRGIRRHAQSLRSRQDLRRLERRRRGGPGGGLAADRRRIGPGREPAQPRELLQRGRSASLRRPRSELAERSRPGSTCRC